MVQYLTHAKGRKMAVMVPIKEWEAIQTELAKRNILDSVRQGYMELLEMERAGVKSKTRETLIRELNKYGEAIIS